MRTLAMLCLVIVFLLMNAFFVVAEFALVRVRKSQLEMAAEDGKPGATAALAISDNLNAYLSACQLGITLASLALGWLGEPAIAALFYPLFSALDMPENMVVAISVAIGYLLLTTLHVVAGELIPKSLAIFSTESYALHTAGPLRAFYRISYPVMWLFNAMTNGVVRMLGHDITKERDVYTPDEIQLLIDESTESGLIEAEQNEFLDNIFELGEKDAGAIMTPRTDIVCVDMQDCFEENIALVLKHKFTRYPVCVADKDHLIGFVHIKDLYTMPRNSTMNDLPVRPIEPVPESMSISKLLQTLQDAHTKMAVVIDEHGGTAGIVTMSDIIEQIVGLHVDEYSHGEKDEIVALEEGVFLVDGATPIDDLCEVLGFEPEEAKECETAGGLLLALFDRIPEEGESISLTHDAIGASAEQKAREAVFLVESVHRHRIEKIKVTLD